MPDPITMRRIVAMMNQSGAILPKRLTLTPATVLDTMETLTGHTGISSTIALNSSEKYAGSNSIKCTSNSGTNGQFDITPINWNLSMVYRTLVMRVYANSALTTFGNLAVLASNDTSYTKYMYGDGNAPDDFMHDSDKWVTFWPYARTDWLPFGGATFADPIVKVRLRAVGVTGQTSIISWDQVEAGIVCKPAVSISLDDGNASIYTLGYPALAARSMTATLYMIGSRIDQAGSVTAAQLRELDAAGWAIGNHTQNHSDLTTLSQADVETELATGKATLDALGLTRSSNRVAYPYGKDSETVWAAMRATGMVLGRKVSPRPSLIEYQDPYRVPGYSLGNGTNLATAKAYLDRCVAAGAVAHFLLHKLAETASDATTWAISDFTALLDYIRAQNVQSINDYEYSLLYDNAITVHHK